MNSCIIRFSFWKDHIGSKVDGELELVESRGRDSNKKFTAVFQVRHGRYSCGGGGGGVPYVGGLFTSK